MASSSSASQILASPSLTSTSSHSSSSTNESAHLSFLNSSSASTIPIPKLSVSGSRIRFQPGLVSNALKTVESPSVSVSNGLDLDSAGFRTKPTILVSEKLGEAGLELLRGFGDVKCLYDLSPEQLCSEISQVDALIVRSGTKVTRQVFEAANGRLKVVGRAGVGIDNVDLQAATEHGCLVVNAPTANTIAAAEHAIALLASMARNVAQADASMKSGKWQRNKYVGVSLVGKTIAVMGFGKVGSEVARRAKGLGMHVIAHDPYTPADRARAIGVELVSFDEAIAAADFISLHMPLTPTTSKILNDDTFAKMKKGVRIINVARGGVIDEEALVRALESGVVAQAALDVFAQEPPPKDSKLLQLENVTLHLILELAQKKHRYRSTEGVAVEIAEAVVGALRGELSATAVNAPMVPAEVLSELAPYVMLAEKLGRLAVQLVTGGKGIQSVKKGLRISEERVNVDSSPDSPIGSIQLQISDVDSRFASALLENGIICIEGRVKYGIPHLTQVGSFSVDVSLEGNLILCRQVDQPGMIGQVGNILGESNCNVNFMSVGRTVKRTKAIMAIGVDEEPDKDTLKKIGEVQAIEEFVFLKL
ncbi:unnamed protein product [Thlaspi arvense]|uniref:phosphoglycerate dehydrogenase n=1 Tax=Thlaspi arvense TaxID=13288 RepID=A0AAU9T8C1_THLAR|nr:unnamed protein product [Thlaspi arvense]